MAAKTLFWLTGGIVAIWLALGCSSLPYSNNTRPAEPPAVPEPPPQPANR